MFNVNHTILLNINLFLSNIVLQPYKEMPLHPQDVIIQSTTSLHISAHGSLLAASSSVILVTIIPGPLSCSSG